MDDLLDLSWSQPTTTASKPTSTSSFSSSAKPNYYNSSSQVKPSPSTPARSGAGDDAFSSLFSSSSAKQEANLSLAERQKRAQQEAAKKVEDDRRRNDALWSGINSFGGAAPKQTQPALTAQRLSSPAPTSRPASGAAKPAADPWDFDAFSSAVPSQPAASSSKKQDPFDFDSFDTPFSSAPTLAVHPDNDDQGDDILGALAMPVSSNASTSLSAHDPRLAALSSSSSASSAESSRVPSPASGSRPPARTRSPPPHVIGQIVEMGFSPQEAKRALAKTGSGVDVQAALELLVGSENAAHQRQGDEDERLARKLQAREASFRDSDDEQPQQQHRRRDQEQQRRARPDGEADGGADWQQQADQLYAQASEIGTSVLKSATAFWSSAKAQAQKALDERNRAAAGGERSGTPSDAGSERHRNRRWGAGAAAGKKEWEGKPKWMLDAEAAEAAKTTDAGSVGGFKDSDNEDEASEPVKKAPPPPARRPAAPAPAAGVAAAAAAMTSAASALWVGKSEDAVVSRTQSPAPKSAKAPYASPNRRAPAAASPSIPPKPTAAALKRRPIPSDSSYSISSANLHKDEGNAHFKLGAYGDAESSYTKGIAALSGDSIRLVPLLSNRANVRLKNGDTTGTVKDCDQILGTIMSIFGGSARDGEGKIKIYPASQEAPLPAEVGEVNLRETFGKALLRRAQALEAGEKWKLARADWEVLLEYEKAEGSGAKSGGKHMALAREGLRRCGKALGDPSSPSAPTSTRPTSTPKVSSAAFAQQQSTLLAEESARFALKDSVDARIDTWKRGKETNLRALLSSLDTIVWPELGWKKIQLHEVLDEKGLKKNYTKAIARLHPDKVRKDATVEQKMIANAAFGALNDAWNAQQS